MKSVGGCKFQDRIVTFDPEETVRILRPTSAVQRLQSARFMIGESGLSSAIGYRGLLQDRSSFHVLTLDHRYRGK